MANFPAMSASSPPIPELSQVCLDRDFVEWHRGCGWCAVWLVLVSEPVVVRQVSQARTLLGPALLARYARQPHVTLAYRGLLDGDARHPATEYGAADLRADIAGLQQLKLAPFELEFQGLGSFSTVPYLDLRETAQLPQIHAALAGGGLRRYQPHLTLGHYAQPVPLEQVCGRLRQAGIGAESRVESVDRLWLMRYASADIAGPLVAEGCFDLRTQRYQPSAQALLRLD